MSAHEADTAIRDFDGFWLPNGQKLKVSLSRDSPKLGQLAQFPMQSGRQKNGEFLPLSLFVVCFFSKSLSVVLL